MIKSEAVQQAQELLQKKEEMLRHQLQSLNEDLKGEIKSSMGDKYETSRAQLHLEIEKLESQMNQLMAQKKVMDCIDFEAPYSKVENGAWVETSQYHFLIGIGLGKITNKSNTFFISLDSPLGQAMNGKMVGEEIEMNKNNFRITKIV